MLIPPYSHLSTLFVYLAPKSISADECTFSLVSYFLGTLRPDLIESASGLASGNADVIKTHHNDTDLVRQLRQKNKVIEPLADFHKDEVRRLGADLNIPNELTQRHPFPGIFYFFIEEYEKEQPIQLHKNLK